MKLRCRQSSRRSSVLPCVLGLACGAALFASSAPAFAWGAQGHRLIARLAAENLPAALPAFLRDADAVDTIEALSVMPDRLKGAGHAWDHDRDPGHYLDLGDDGKVAGVVALDALPPDREAYDTALRGAGTDQYKMGYLPYAIVDGWQQVTRDLAMWRAADAQANGAGGRGNESERRFFARERSLWAAMAVHDIGVWSHFVGDASQPLHVTIHFNGWGDGPNPDGYTTRHIHAFFEANYLRHNVTTDAVRHALPAPRQVSGDIFAETGRYLKATAAHVPDVYRLEKGGAFTDGNTQAVGLEVSSLAAGVGELRDLIVAAWAATDTASVGYPAIPLADIVAGRAGFSRSDVIDAH